MAVLAQTDHVFSLFISSPMSLKRRFLFPSSVRRESSFSRAMQNEDLLVSKSGRCPVWHGSEEEEEENMGTHTESHREERQASEARRGRDGKRREGINWRCSLNTSVAWPRPRPPRVRPSADLRHHKSSSLSSRVSSCGRPHARRLSQSRWPRPRPSDSVRPCVRQRRARTPTTLA